MIIERYDTISGERTSTELARTSCVLLDSEGRTSIALPRLEFVRLRLPVYEDFLVLQGSSPLPPLAIGGRAVHVSPLFGEVFPIVDGTPPPVLRPGDLLDVGPYQLRFQWRLEDGPRLEITSVTLPVGGHSGRTLLVGVAGPTSHDCHVLATREEDGGLVPRAAFRVPFDGPRYVLQEAPVSPQHLLVAHDYKLYWSLDGGRTFHWPDRMQLARLQPEKSGLRRLWFSRFLDDEWPQVVIAHFPGKNLLDAVTTIRKLGLPVATMRTLCDAAPAVARIEIWQLGPGRCDLVATVEPGSPEAVRLEDDHRACRREPSDLPLRAEPGGCLVRSGTGWAPLDLRELARAAVRDLGVAP